jgi:hypothetical protein
MTRSGVPQLEPGALNLVRLSVPAREPAVPAKDTERRTSRSTILPGNLGCWLVAKRLPTQALVVQRE